MFKMIGKIVGILMVVIIAMALFSIVSPVILTLGVLGVWYYTKKQPDSKMMKASVVAIVLGLFGTIGLMGAGTEEASEITPVKTEQVAEKESSKEKSSEEILADKEKAEAVEKAAAEQKAKEAELKAAQDAEKKAQEEADALAEAEAKAAAEAEQAAALAALEAEAAALKDPNTYRWDVSYDNLARTPDDFAGQKIALSGKVIQVMESSGTTQLRIAVNDDYDTVVLVEYDSSISPSRILDNDYVNIFGNYIGLFTYSSTMGGEITVPAMLVNIINLR